MSAWFIAAAGRFVQRAGPQQPRFDFADAITLRTLLSLALILLGIATTRRGS